MTRKGTIRLAAIMKSPRAMQAADIFVDVFDEVLVQIRAGHAQFILPDPARLLPAPADEAVTSQFRTRISAAVNKFLDTVVDSERHTTFEGRLRCFSRSPKGRGGNIAMADFGLSAFAMFFMQSASFLSFQRKLEKGQGCSNCTRLFGIGKIPSDNYIRDMLDAADPALLDPCFRRLETLLAEPPMPQAFGRRAKALALRWDGTEFFSLTTFTIPPELLNPRKNL